MVRFGSRKYCNPFVILTTRSLFLFYSNLLSTLARFPTVRGVVRRGIDIKALREFMYSQGASRRVVNMVWNTFWAENKKEIDKKAKRFMAIDGQQHAVLNISNCPSEEDHAYIETQVHPKDPSLGTRLIRTSNKVLLEAVDVEGIEVGEDIVLLRWGAYIAFSSSLFCLAYFEFRRC